MQFARTNIIDCQKIRNGDLMKYTEKDWKMSYDDFRVLYYALKDVQHRHNQIETEVCKLRNYADFLLSLFIGLFIVYLTTIITFVQVYG